MSLLGGVGPAVTAVVRAAIADPLLRRDIVYKRFTGQTQFDSQKGFPVDVYESLSVRSAYLTHEEREVVSSGVSAQLQAGNHVYLILASSLLANGRLKKDFSDKDIIIDEGEERKIDGLNWALQFAVQVIVKG